VQNNNRREDLDRAKGLGILLVVLGHIVARQPPLHNEWYVVLKYAIYQFHMPFFMYLSGYVTFLSGAARLPSQAWPKLAARRASRLLLPFVIFGLTIVAGKLLLGPYLHVDNLPMSAGQALSALLWDTDHSPATSVWYIAVLFVLCVSTPPLLRLLAGRTRNLLLLTVALYVLPVPHVMYLDRVAGYYVFFVLGGLAAEAGEHWLGIMDRHVRGWLAALVAALAASYFLSTWLTHPAALFLCGVISMPALHGLVRLPALSKAQGLLLVGCYSFVIYLLNTPCIGLAKAVLWKLMPWDGLSFLLYAPILMAAGTFGPILIKRHLLRRIPALDRMTA